MKATEPCHLITWLKEVSSPRAPTPLGLQLSHPPAPHPHPGLLPLSESFYLPPSSIRLPRYWPLFRSQIKACSEGQILSLSGLRTCLCIMLVGRKLTFGFTMIFLFSTDHVPLTADTQRGPLPSSTLFKPLLPPPPPLHWPVLCLPSTATALPYSPHPWAA